ncbi:MAG: sugar phosphate isomerase/epimerase [Burkholderiales bacterium]|nr:sugar phosphate isomerase/epimerase [Burkholderiales bacterium]
MPIISLDHLTLFELTPPQLVAVAHDAGFAHVGLRLNPAAPPGERQHPVIGDTPMRRETLARMRDSGVAVFDFGVFRLKEGVDLTAFEPVLETAAVLGAHNAVVNGDDPDAGRTAELLHRLCELGEKYAVVMHLEATPWSGVRTLNAAVDIVQRCRHPRARVMIDPIHVDRSRATLADLRAVAPACIDYVQICDAVGPRPDDFETMIFQARNERAFPGDGNLDLVGMLSALPSDLPLSLEAPVQSLAALPVVERARRGYQSVLALLAALDAAAGRSTT